MNKYGLTLIEVIIASLILAIAVAGVLFIFSTEKGVVARTGRRFEAMEFARQTLEELKDEVDARTWDEPAERLSPGAHDQGRDPFLSLSGDFGPGGSFEGAGRSYVVTPGPANDAYRVVTVTVDWDEPTE